MHNSSTSEAAKPITRFIILFLFTLMSISINASKAVRFFRDITLKDGRIVSATLVGDENLHFYKTQNGEIVLYNSDGDYYHYASKEQIDSINAIANQLQQQASENSARMMRSSITATGTTTNGRLSGYRLFPSKGDQKVLVLMVEFSDVSFNFGQDDFEKFLNSEEMTTDVAENGFVVRSQGSVAGYFRACSGGQLSLQFDIYGTFKVNNTAKYYSSREDTFIKDACAAADNVVNFADYDQDGDGYVDLVYIIYAGYGANWVGKGNAIWPKVKYRSGTPFCTVDGKNVHRAGMSNELNFYPTVNEDYKINPPIELPKLAGIGVFAHEFCHAMGITDFYATSDYDITWGDANYDNQSMEEWSLMDGGENRCNGCLPTPLNAFERYLFGWIDDIQELTEPEKVTLTPLKNGGQAYKIRGNNDNEYWILEAIPSDNYWYMGFKKNTGTGMVVTHINTAIENFSLGPMPNSKKGNPGITVVPADGRLIGYFDYSVSAEEYYENLLGDPFPGSQIVTQLTDYWAKDGTIDKPIYNITQNSDYSVGFNFMYLRGDANGDGKIGMSDVMYIVNYTLGNQAEDFNALAADANEDGIVNIDDAMTVANYILNGK